EELVVRLLKLFSYQDDIVLDPFNGVGTTTLVAYKLRRKYIGIDISEEYCKTAEKRLKEEQRQGRLF
ncbi:MAG: site-specific DNA-methyltransferase, partial [Deltaproteobacteria bacterium]|nr:site-specific DNA-methyltransferase [Deltaproteobacteria bacterium]